MQLTRAQINIAASWHSGELKAHPAGGTAKTYTGWWLSFSVASALTIRVVQLLRMGTTLWWGLADGAERHRQRVVRAEFHHQVEGSWREGDVRLHFGRTVYVGDAGLRRDPRPFVLIRHPEAATGEVTEVASIPAHSISLSVLALAHDDTEDRRLHKWRVRPSLKTALPDHLAELASGNQSGRVTD